MAEPLDVEEGWRWEAMKAFAHRNRFLIGGIIAVVVIALAAGWAWYRYQQQQVLAASSHYRSAIAALSEDQTEQARQALATLIQDYPETDYAAFGRIFQARLLHENDQVDRAARILDPLVRNGSGPGVARQIAVEERARIHWGRGNIDRALTTLERIEDRAFLSSYFLLKGDLLAASDRPDAARKAYETARSKPGARSLQPGLGARLDRLPGETESNGEAP